MKCELHGSGMFMNEKINNLKRASPEKLLELIRLRGSLAQSLQVPLKYAMGLKKSLDGSASPRGAIKAKCLECVGYEDAENRIRDCTVKRCPLLSYRPYQRS